MSTCILENAIVWTKELLMCWSFFFFGSSWRWWKYWSLCSVYPAQTPRWLLWWCQVGQWEIQRKKEWEKWLYLFTTKIIAQYILLFEGYRWQTYPHSSPPPSTLSSASWTQILKRTFSMRTRKKTKRVLRTQVFLTGTISLQLFPKNITVLLRRLNIN